MNASLIAKLQDKLRAWPLLVLFLVCLFVVWLLAPAKLGLVIWGLAKLGMAGYVGYHIDRQIFPYARPHTLQGSIEGGWAQLRRALIVAAAILAAGWLP